MFDYKIQNQFSSGNFDYKYKLYVYIYKNKTKKTKKLGGGVRGWITDNKENKLSK